MVYYKSETKSILKKCCLPVYHSLGMCVNSSTASYNLLLDTSLSFEERLNMFNNTQVYSKLSNWFLEHSQSINPV